MFKRLCDPFRKIYPASNHATYIRGIAALGVVLIHYNGLGITSLFIEKSLNDIIATKLVNIGGQGPTVFFIASGYVLYESFQRTPNFLRFMFLRYFRLMPLYLVVSFFASLNQMLVPDIFTIITKLLFLDIFSQKAYLFSPINIGFFVVIEFWLSLTLFLSVLIPKFKLKKFHNIYYLTLTSLSFICHYIAVQMFETGMINRPYFDLFRFQFWFILGSVLSAYKSKVTPNSLYNLVCVALVLFSFSTDNYLGYFVGFASVAFLLSESSAIVNYSLVFIGNICYSIYLLHQPLLYFFTNSYYLIPILVLIIVILVSSLTFRFIEVPFIKLSKSLIKRR